MIMDRVLALPLWVHAAALGVVLIALAPSSHPDAIWTADEGAVRVQAEALSTDGSWALPRPLAHLDPEERSVPIHNAVIDGAVYYPFSKHPASPLLMAPLERLGPAWMIAPMLVAAWIAAWVTGAIGRRWSHRVGVASLWAVGLASPLFLYGFTVVGHAAGTAFSALAVLGILLSRSGSRWGLGLTFGALIGASLFRTEALLFALALAIAIAIEELLRRRTRGLVAAAVVAAGGVAGYALNTLWETSLAGDQATLPDSTSGLSTIATRIVDAAWTMTLRPTTTSGVAAALLLFAAGIGAVLTLAIRRDPNRTGLHVVLAVCAAATAVASLLFAQPVVAGLLVAMPLLAAGLVAAVPATPASDSRLLLVASALYFAAVIVSPAGSGGFQWGGRYLMLALPALVPVAIAGLAALLRTAPRPSRAATIAALVVMSAVLAASSFRALRDLRTGADLFAADLHELVVRTGIDAATGKPLVVSRIEQLGRLGWQDVRRADFFIVPADAFEEYLARIAADDHPRFGVGHLANDPDDVRLRSLGYEFVDEEPSAVPFVLLEIVEQP